MVAFLLSKMGSGREWGNIQSCLVTTGSLNFIPFSGKKIQSSEIRKLSLFFRLKAVVELSEPSLRLELKAVEARVVFESNFESG